MKTITLLLLMVTATTTLAMESHSIVKVSGFDKSSEYRLLNGEELKALQTELREESKHFPRALVAAKQEWAKDETKKRKRFPMLTKRSLRVVRSYTKPEDAEKKMASYAPEIEAPARRKKGEEDKKAIAAAEKKALKQVAVDMVAAHIKTLSEGKVKAPTPGTE